MNYRTLGRTGLQVSEVGLGTEYLNGQPRETVVAVVQEAIARGVTYFDLVFSFSEYLGNMGAALHGTLAEGHRERLILTGHLGSTEKDGQYCKSRDAAKSEAVFLSFLSRLNLDHVDVLFLHNCDSQKDYDQLVKRGQLDLALRLRQEDKARFIGFSGHTVATALQAVQSGHVDVLMFQVNMATHAVPGKKELLQACAAHGVGVVAMKPYGGGRLLSRGRTIHVGKRQGSGEAFALHKNRAITPVHCLAYTLAQTGVCTAVPGCANLEQMQAALAYCQATEEEKDFSPILTDFQHYVTGECVYCNHCLPCPSHIDIGRTLRMFEMARHGLTPDLRAVYAAMPARAADCTRCGACETRCPFGVSVMTKMTQAAELFA